MKKLSIFLLLMALFSPLAMMGQQTLVVANGTGTNAEIPFYGLYADDNYQHTQTIYPSSMLTQMEGGTITKLTYHLSSSATKDYGTTFEIRLGTTSSTSFSTGEVNYISMTGSPAYSNTLSVSGTTVEFNLSTPYTYNGGNLVVDVRTTTLGSGWQSLSFYGESGSTAYSVKNRSTSSLPTSTGTAVTFMPKTTFTYLSTDPYITLAPAAATVLTGFTETLTATYGNVSGTPTITYSSSNTSVATVSGSGTTATVTAVAPGTATITATMNGSYTATCAITVEDPSYCTPSFGSNDDCITNITLGSINNTTAGSSTYGYGDYTSMSTSLEQGETATMSLTSGAGSGTHAAAVWIDFNDNYEFESSERVGTQGNIGASATVNITLSIPNDAAVGSHRLRVVYQYSTAATSIDPCASATYGEGEDYTVVIPALGAYTITCATTTGGTISADKNNADENDVITITATPEADYTLTALTYTPEGGSAQNIDITNTPYTFTMPAANVTVNATFSLPACPRPTNLTVSNLMPTSATLNWEGEAESYNVRYRKAAHTVTLFSEGFENGIPSTWTTIDSDGDGNNWMALSEISSVYTSYSGTLSDWAHSESNAATSPSYANGVGCMDSDQWLISPQVPLQGTLRFYAASTYDDLDAYEVLLSTTGTATTDFTTTLQAMKDAPYALNDGTDDWEEVTIDLSSYSGQGYIAIHHVSNCMYFLVVDDFEIYEEVEENWTPATAENGATSKDIDGLDPEYEYEWQVQADCGSEDGQSSWSAIATFTTPDACTVPTGLTAEVTGNAAELSWTGVQENYNVQYREVDPTVPATIILNVPNDIWNDGSGYQMLLDADATAFDNFESDGISDYSIFEYLIPTNATYDPNTTGFVINTSVTIQIPAGTYDWFITNPSPDYNNVYIAASNGNVGGRQNNYVFEAGMTYEFTPSLFGNNDGVDVTITDNGNAWTLIEGVTNPYTLENLSSQTTYKYKVQGVDCDGNGNNTDWSASASFTTGEFYTKTIEAYEGDGGYYLIASPLVNNVAPTDVTGMITDNLGANVDETTSTYDLYSFNQAQELEWQNYRASNNFSLVNGQGYLYASKEGTELVFTGAGNTGNTQDVTLYMTDAATGLDFPDWNLVGNPFAKDEAYLSDGREFYSMQNSGVYTPQLGPVAIGPMEGVFVVANSNEETLTFTTTQPNKKVAQLTLNLTKSASAGSTLLDRAIVSFDEGSQLPKLQFRNGSTKVYMPMDGKEYAIVSAEAMGTMPVNFKAENNGNYTLSFTTEDVNFAYLHLIDNMNGNDVDLLANPSYSFEAKTTDYESRFKLVFAAGNSNDDTFAFYSNGSFVINNEGNATLQVIDVNGRILKSESINGCANVNVNAAQGIYMLRLVNGNDVKVQKVVVR